MWNNIEAAPADAILGLTEAFKSNPNPQKVNLGVGVYKDEQGNTPVLQCVKNAEKILFERQNSKSYLPIVGSPEYGKNVQVLLFGEGSEVITSGRAATAHAPGGTGALRVGAELLKKFKPDARVWVSSPTWANHKGIFGAAGFELGEYDYYDAANFSLDFPALLKSLENVPAGDIVLMHACCHNPSGVDLDGQQWGQVCEIAKTKGWMVFLDFAYQGFSSSVDDDRVAVETFAKAGVDFVVASSFSKNFGLYNERTGAITVICPSKVEAEVAASHLKTTIRVLYSNPPAHGGLVVATVLGDSELKKLWLDELETMRQRIIGMRGAFADGLKARGVAQDFSFIKEQKGMFSFSGLNDNIVGQLRDNKAIYVVGGGRINVAGLTTANIDYVCDAVAELINS